MKTTLPVAVILTLFSTKPVIAAEGQGLPWKQPLAEVELRTSYAIVPDLQGLIRYSNPTELTDAHALSLYLGPKLQFGGADDAFWVLPQIGARLHLGHDCTDAQLLVAIWGKFSMLDRALSYQFLADLAVDVPLKQRGIGVDVRHMLDYNIVIPTESVSSDPEDREEDELWHRSRHGRDPWKRDHWLLQLGIHAQNRNQYVDIGPAIGTKYHWLRVCFEYLLGFQEANRGQTFRVTVGLDFNL
jgi:hypothetical protein